MKNRVQLYREAQKLTRAELARKVGVDRSYISRIEQAKRSLGIKIMLKLARILDCTVEDLFCLD